jgi:hypothetical protein
MAQSIAFEGPATTFEQIATERTTASRCNRAERPAGYEAKTAKI